MYDAESVKALSHQLETRLNDASRAERYKDAVTIATALETLKAWDAAGRGGELPAEVTALEGLTLPGPATVAPPAGQVAAPAAGPLPPGDPVAPEFANALREANAATLAGQFDVAQARLHALQKMVSNTAEESVLRSAQRTLNERLTATLGNAIEEARAARQRGASPQVQRTAWEAVQRLDPELPEAVDALRMLETIELARSSLEQLTAIQRRLSEIRYDINEITQARRIVEGMLYDKALENAGRKPEVELLLSQLNEMRTSIQQASDGGTSSERSGALEKAFDVFRKAFRDGFVTIVDDQTGEPVKVQETYDRIRRRYFDLQISRTDERFNDATQALKSGSPEVAVNRLKEARELLETVEDQSGVEWRTRVEAQLEKSRQEAEAKAQADTLITQARDAGHERQKLRLYQSAAKAYSKYPGIGELIRDTETNIIRIILNDVRILMESARTYLGGRKFPEARRACEDALRAGQEFSFVQNSADYQAQHGHIDAMLRNIGDAEVHWQKLQEKIDAIQTALDGKNLRVARRLLEQIADADLADARVTALSMAISVNSEDAQQEADAQKAFDGQRYEQVITICETLQDSGGPYAESAGRMLRRAQVRLWSRQAAAAQSSAQLDAATGLYEKVVGLSGMLPPEDALLIEQARTALRAVTQERSDSQRYTKELDDLQKDRSDCRWDKWYQGLRALRQRAPDWFKPRIEEQLGSGMDEWRAYVLSKVAQHTNGDQPDWQKLFDLMHPLHLAGGITVVTHRDAGATGESELDRLAEDELSAHYRKAAVAYYRKQATEWEQSGVGADIKHAYQFRLNIYNMAPQPAVVERKEMIHTLRLWVETEVRSAAANGGPAQAVQELDKKLQTYDHELKTDGELHKMAVTYALLAQQFDRAAREADALQYLYSSTDQREQARGWQQLVSALRTFFSANGQANREQGVRELMLLRETLSEAHSHGTGNSGDRRMAEAIDDFAVRLADGLHNEVQNTSAALSNEQILQCVRVYDLILQLRSDDKRARTGIEQLAVPLNQIGTELVRRARTELARNSGSAGHEQMDVLNNELRAILQAYRLLNQLASPTANQLAYLHEQVRQRIQQDSNLQQLLESLAQMWVKVLTKTWDVQPLSDKLNSVPHNMRHAWNIDLSEWNSKVETARETLGKLKGMLRQISENWEAEEFDDVVRGCDQFDNELINARRELGRELTLLSDFAMNDRTTRQPLNSVKEVRNAAYNKQMNYQAWEYWMATYRSHTNEVRVARAAAEQSLDAQPPCLTRGRQQLALLLKSYSTLVTHLEAQPKELLSKKADTLTREVLKGNIKTLAEQGIATGQARLEKIDQRMQEIQIPLQKLRRWRSHRLNFTNDSTRKLFRGFLEELRKIDACNPDVEEYVADYLRITNKTTF